MNATMFAEAELEAAVGRSVSQYVVIGSKPRLPESLQAFPVFLVDAAEAPDAAVTFIPTCFQSEDLAAALANSQFDKLKSTVFVWLGGVGYRTLDAALASLSFIGSLPKGSGVLLDYIAERSSLRSCAGAALDALASRVSCAGGTVKHLIQPQAVCAMLRSLGFQSVVDVPGDDGTHLVSAVV